MEENCNRNGKHVHKCFSCDGREIRPGENGCPFFSNLGFHYGEGLFETVLVREGRPIFLDEHLDRITSSAKELAFPPLPENGAIHDLVNQNLSGIPGDSAILKIIISIAGNGRYSRSNAQSLIHIHIAPHSTPLKKAAENGVTLITSDVPRNAGSYLQKHKTLNYLESVMARRKAESEGAYEALIVDTDDMIVECSMSNLFFVTNDHLFTPPLSCNILPGITRGKVLDLAAQDGIKTSERLFSFIDILDSTEAFVTNSISGIVPVKEIDGKAIGRECPGVITRRLSNLYSEHVLSAG